MFEQQYAEAIVGLFNNNGKVETYQQLQYLFTQFYRNNIMSLMFETLVPSLIAFVFFYGSHYYWKNIHPKRKPAAFFQDDDLAKCVTFICLVVGIIATIFAVVNLCRLFSFMLLPELPFLQFFIELKKP